jgi:hypothetical protein
VGVRDRLYVGKPFQRKVPLGDTRDFVAVREYLRALDGVLKRIERIGGTTTQTKISIAEDLRML